MFTIGVFAIILDKKNRILFCHRRDCDLWNLPGGALKSGETPWEGVIREVKEETGFDVEVEKMTGVYSKTYSDDIVMQFKCSIIGGEKTLNDEADKIKYFSFEDIPKNTVPKQVERIKDYLSNQDKFYMKNQTSKSVKKLIKEGFYK